MHEFLDLNRGHSTREKSERWVTSKLSHRGQLIGLSCLETKHVSLSEGVENLATNWKQWILYRFIGSWIVWVKFVCPTHGLKPHQDKSHLWYESIWLWTIFGALWALDVSIGMFSSSGACSPNMHSKIVWRTFSIVFMQISIYALFGHSTRAQYGYGGTGLTTCIDGCITCWTWGKISFSLAEPWLSKPRGWVILKGQKSVTFRKVVQLNFF